MSKGLQIALATLSIFVGLVWILTRAGGQEGTFSYYSTVSEYVQAVERRDTSSRSTRVHGFVLTGSIQKDLPAGHVDFVIHDKTEATLTVRLLGIEVPDLFQDGAEVVVEGRLEGTRFVARRVLAKCPSKYEPATGSEA